MSTQAYYKDRLGFDPGDALDEDGVFDKSKQGYEENLSKFKDERDAIQKKTFTKWVNKHLKKANRHVNDLFLDLQDGHNLISLLEVLSGEHLPRERGKMRFHMLQNVQMALDFLRYKKIKLVNIRAEDIVDGNPKLTLGLIWTIILHFQISDIVVGQEPNVSAKDVLLRWARRSTAKYPGVKVSDFTQSWRDGLAFNALIHRNRPDLIDWRNIRSRQIRDRLENAFHVAEREYGVTRLLDPEDVDTHEIDEKSIITYISSLYDVFPEPPAMHPLYDSESQSRVSEYRELASSLVLWMREKTAIMSDRHFPPTLIEIKKLVAESNRFRTEEIPSRQRDKTRLQNTFRDLQRYFESVGEVDVEPELHIDNIERNWNRLMMAHSERDHALQDELKRLERLQKLAEKVHREMKRVDTRLEDLESRVNEEARRLDRLHPLDAKRNGDVLEEELRATEENIQTLFNDVTTLREGHYPQASDLHKRVQKLHQRWVSLRSLLQSKLIQPLASLSFPVVEERTVTRQTRTVLETRLVDTNIHFRQLHDCLDWVKSKLKQLQEAEFGSDLPGVEAELDLHKREHKTIEQFHTRVEHCINAKNNFHGDELSLYVQHLNLLQKNYSELVSTSNRRLTDLETLHDFLQSATNQLVWLNEREETEITRDWSSRDINIPALEQYYESLMSELEKREIGLSSVQDRGEALLLQQHPAAKCIEAFIAAIQAQWAWLLQLVLCLETHLKHAAYHQHFFKDVREIEAWLNRKDELLNSTYSQSEFTLDEGEALLRGLGEVRDELNAQGELLSTLEKRAQNVVPLKQRRQPVARPMPVLAVCSYNQGAVRIEKGEQWILHDNSGRVKWRVSNGSTGSDCNVPGVVFLIPPPDREALDALERLRRQFERSLALWQRKQLRMRQNMIFATIRVVRGWDLTQFLAMGADQRNAIRKALNEDASKLLTEGDSSDPQLRRLRREMDDVNRLFDEFERRARAEEESKNAGRIFNEQATALITSLDEAERTLNTRLASPVPRDLDTLEHLVVQHKDFEQTLKSLAPDLETAQATFKSIARKTPAQQQRLDKLLAQWNHVWNCSHLYVERLKCVEMLLSSLDEANTVLSDFELRLASFGEMPSNLESLQRVHEELIRLQKDVSRQQPAVDQLIEDGANVRRVVDKSRSHLPPRAGPHPDMERLDTDLHRLTQRWNNICSQLMDRLRSCENAYSNLTKLANSYQTEVTFLDTSYNQLNSLSPIKSQAKEQIEPTKALFNSVVERTSVIETVNIDGGRFIREAKIYNRSLQRYREWLVEDVHPSLDASPTANATSGSGGEADVARDLDILNHRFQALLSILQDRMKKLAEMNPHNSEFQEFASSIGPKPLRTFRTEFNIYESAGNSAADPLGVSVKHSSQTRISTSDLTDPGGTPVEGNVTKSVASVRVTRGSSKEKIVRSVESDSTNTMGANTSKTNGETNVGTTMRFSEIRSLRRVQRVEEGIGTDAMLDMPGIVHPQTGELLTVGDAVRLRILDVRSGRINTVVEAKPVALTIKEAVAKGLVDAGLADRLLGPSGITVGTEDAPDGSREQISLLEAIQRELYDAERGPHERVKQAMEEKYKLCEEVLSQLLAWISEVEDRLANQDVAQENTEHLRNQINILKLLKEELDSQQRSVANCLDQVRVIVTTGGEYLSREEVASLERNGKSLRTRYDRATDRTERLLRRLIAAGEELSKFKSELTVFSNWLEQAKRSLDEREHSLGSLNRTDASGEHTREFVSDVIAHQADLRFITMAAQKFVDESKEYLTCLNEFRTSLPARLPHIEPISAHDSAVRNNVVTVTAQYKDLLNRANALADKLSGVGGCQRDYRDALDKARSWMRDAEIRANKLLSEPFAADPHSLQDQLGRAKTLNNEFVAQARLIDNLKGALENLVRAVEGQVSGAEIAALREPVYDLESKYSQLSDALAERCKLLDTALVQSQGVQDALDSLLAWLSSAESRLKDALRPVSLNKERLEDRLREYRVLQSDIDTHRPSVDSVTASAQELVATASNPRLAKKIETKLKDVISRMSKVQERCLKLGDQLSEIQLCLTQFSTNASQLQRWLSEATETAQETSGAGIDELIAQRDARRDKFESTVREGKALVNRNDVTDTGAIRDQVKAIETQWKELNQLLDEKLRLGKARTEQQLAYERLRDQVHVWLSTMETRVGRLEPVAVDVETVKRQAEELKPLLKDHREYASTIDKVNELGQALDALTRPASESPTRRRSSVSPVKRMSQVTRDSQSARRQSQDIGGSPSPTKITSFSLQSPLSPGGSSGFGSRRSSPDNFHLEEMTPVQHELNEVNNRYSLLGVRLSDRQSEIDSLKDELRKHADHLRQLSQFLDKVQRTLPKETIAQTKDEAEKTCRAARAIQEEMYEKQALLESTRAGVSDLLRRKGSVAGADRLHDELQEVVSRWRSLQDACKNRIAMMEGLKDFYDTHDNLSSWLASKDRMITVLGPISSDSRMVQSQVQQVQVLREEFRTQQPQLQHLSDVAADVLSRVPADTPDAAKINNKLRAVQDRWNDLSARLDARLASLGAAADTTREFDAALTRLRDTLQAISDQLDDVPTDREPEEQLRKVQMLERQLEGARPLLADLESAGADLCAVLSDAASRADIQAKLSAVDRQYSALQKKLDLRKAEIENTLRDGRQFEATCAKMLGWLSEQVAALNERLLVSADRDILQQQVDAHEPIYKEVLQKEHEVIMLLNKGQELISRAANMNAQRTDTRSLQRDVDKIQQVWERLRKDASERHNRLQTCMEHCRKYYRANDAFAPWLAQAEARLDSLRPDSFKRRDVDRQLRELSAFRNEVWKRSGEFENLRSHGETFVAACDVDKEVVKQELATVKTRWDKLNNELLEKNQWLEEMSRRLADFTDQLRDLNHSVQRCEDRLASHDAIATAARDPKALERIKSLREETNALRKPLAALKKAADDLVSEAAEVGVSDASHLRDEVDAIGERLDDLQGRLDDRCSRLQSAATAVSQFNDLVKTLVVDLNSLESELDAMKPPGRDVKTVRSQQDDLARLVAKISRASDEVNRAVNAGEHLVDSGFALDTAGTRDQVESLSRQLGRLEERTRAREEELADVLDKLQDFYKEHSRVVDNITQAGEDLRRLRPVGSEVDAIKCQQDEFASFRRSTVEPLSQAVDNVNRNGQGLIRSAAGGVNTNILEKDLEKMNDKWNALKDKLNERDRRLDVGLLQSGKFQEALEGFAKWLSDTEEMVANQKPPSADYKVVKAQLQEQKFLKKMLADRQNSMSSLFAMGNEVAADADMQERKAIERQLKELMSRFEKLCEGAAQRYDALMEAMAVAKDFQDKLVPVTEWLDRAEKKVKDMELVPTDEEKIQQRIREHDALHDEILRKKTDLSELTEVGSNLMALVGEEEASATADKIQDAADRYATLVDRSDALGQLLEASRAGLRHLVLTYQDLQAWMESMEASLNRYKVLAVHTDKLLMQMDDLADLTEEVSNHQNEVDATVDSGLELMKHISSDEAIQLKDKLDSLQRRYNDLTSRCSDMLKHAQDALPLVQQFHNAHNSLVDWMLGAEAQLQVAEPSEDDIRRLEQDVQEFRPVLETINLVGPQLCQISPGEGAATIEGLVTRDNRRFDAIAEQVQRKAMRLQLSKQRSLEVIGDIDDLLDWFREVETQLREAEPPSSEPDVVRLQLKEHKALNDDISGQKGRVRDVLSTAKKVLRESTQHNDDTSAIRERTEDLRETMETVSGLSSDRLGALEQALALAEHFGETHTGLASWLDDTERHVAMLALPALRPDLIAAQQDKHELLVHAVNEQRPLVDKLNKTGEALIKLCGEDDGAKVQDALDSDNARYAALKAEIRQRQLALEKALQESSQFSDKLEGMLRALAQTADQVSSAEPISAHPPRIRSQLDENAALVEDLGRREEAFQAVRRAANDVINKAPTADPAVKDIRRKLERLNSLWNEVQSATSDRSRSLEDALAIAERFWDELQSVMATLRDLEDSLTAQEPPAVRPQAIQRQQSALQEIKSEMDHAKPEVEACRQTGQSLMRVCGEPDKPEVRKHMEDLDSAWDNVTALFAKREENLIHAMEKAMEFHETLQELLDFLDKAEDKFSKLGPLGADIDAVKKQINQLKSFKSEVDPHMVKVEALNRQAQELTERTSAEQAAALREPLARVNQRWDELLRGVVERQRQLENALLRLGQFQHALAELMAWIDGTERTLDRELKVAPGDPQLLEVELAKLKVLVNDIQAHQSSVDTLNDAGRQIIEQGKGTDEASSTHDKLTTLNRRWRELLQKAADRQGELEEALRDAHRFSAELQDLLSWLGEVDGIIAASKPVGGLPETASEQLERFMEIYNELEENRPKVETVLQQGTDYLSKAQPGAASNLATNVRTLKQRWESVTARANDKKIKLEIALKEATEFHDALQAFVDWLTSAEKTLAGLKPVSRVLATILEQIEEHKAFQKEVGVHRETMLHLDKKGTHLKYFSQKQDVILIKNLLISVQHRWERVVSKSAERTRALDHGYKEARDFHDAYSNLMNWLNDTEHSLDELEKEASSIGNDPDRIKARLAKHRELQRALSGKQATYDATMRAGKSLKEKAPKSDEPALRQMMNDLKEKWNTVCAKSVDRQRKLEEALLYCGQFKDALEALADWLKKVERELSEDTLVHGDLDTVTALVDQHKALREELTSRSAQMESVRTTADELARKASPADAQTLRNQVGELNSLWTRTNRLAERKSQRLEEALKVAETLHKRVHMLLEWLSDAEMKLRFVNSLPDDDQETRNQLAEHAKFMREMMEKEVEKDATITLAQQILAKAHPDAVSVIKHWITIIQARWDEVSTWAKQREQRLDEHLRSLQDLDALLEELLAWLAGLENTLMTLEAEPLPEDIPTIEGLIRDHHEFMENTARRQGEVDSVIKARTQQPPPAPSASSTPRKTSAKRLSAASRSSPTRELRPAEGLPHIGPRFPPKGSKGSEPVFRSPRCRLLWDRWRGVWLLAWQRQRRLQERLNYLQELERVKNFSWDQWRKKFLKFMNHKKSRLTDLFRKMDKNNDGLIPREDFVDGIIRTKFDTSRLEMSAVADMFDHNGEAFIDWKEFIAALRPDWEERSPTTEAEKIHDEVKRLVMLCTCRQKFRVFQVGEGKYRFGDSQKLRLVRILRSTVMVRVGGGWVALDEFLVKNDPCRAKGRTNVELREQFILADGVSQSMSAFKPKASPGSQRSLSLSSGAQGPITKVRERSARSVPMGKTVTGRTGTPDSLSDTEGSPLYARTPVRKASSSARRSSATPGGSLPGSRPASRQGSKPPSRHGSNLSLASSDDGTPSRIPRRSVPASRSSGTTTPTARKLTAPTINGRTRSPSTTPVTKSSMHRASSIPTLSGYNSSWMSGIPTTPSSNIPRLIRTRTPSGSSTPVPAGLGATASSKLVRRPSAAADSAASSARKSSSSSATGKATTPDSKPAPFRL